MQFAKKNNNNNNNQRNLKRKPPQNRFLRWFGSGLLFKALSTARTFDADAALVPGNADGLTTGRAGVVPVFTVCEELDEAVIRSGFPLTGRNIPGEHPEHAPEQQCIGKNHKKRQILNETAEDAQDQSGAEQQHIQFIGTVSAVHKNAESFTESAKHRNPSFCVVT